MKKIGALTLLTAALSLVLAQVAFAQGSGQTYQANLAPLNGSGASGTATVTQNGNRLTVDIESAGLTPSLVHAQHIHGDIGMVSTCPTEAADKNGDGFISVAEGQPAYGGFQASLTTKGDTSPDSALAADRMPTADPDGTLSYSRTFTVPSKVANNLADFAIVQHGIDLNGSGKYDGTTKGSPDPSVPFEATVPANCGELVPVTMPDTGGVSPISLALAAGAALASLGAATLYLARRRTA